MLTTVRSDRLVAASLERVWAMLIDPHIAPLQDGVAVVGTWGEPGTVGSGYSLTARTAGVRFPVEATVVDTHPPTGLVVDLTSAGRSVATSRYALGLSDGGTRVEVVTTCPGLLARLTRGATRRTQDRWLERFAALLDC